MSVTYGQYCLEHAYKQNKQKNTIKTLFLLYSYIILYICVLYKATSKTKQNKNHKTMKQKIQKSHDPQHDI